MIFVLNKCFGAWSLSEEAAAILGTEVYPWTFPEMERVAELIKERGSEFVSGPHAKLKVVEIPDTATDYEINEYDGAESITYVVDGKLYHA
jgi:hypothetical protein